MRNLLCTFLVIISSFSFAQIQYTELEPFNKSFVDLIYVTNQGDFIGLAENPRRLLTSKDKGNAWEVFFSGSPLDENNSRNLIIRQNDDNDIYIAINKAIYRYVPSSKSLKALITLNSKIEDFAFLPTGNIVSAENRSFNLYAPNGDLIRSHTWWTHTAQFLIGEGNDHYVKHSHGASYSMVHFNSDITGVGGERSAFRTNHEYYYVSGRILCENGYTDDGNNWKSFGSAYRFSNLAVTRDKKVVAFSGNDVYVSLDLGDSFTRVGNAPATPYKLFAFLSEGLIIENALCESTNVFISEDVTYWDTLSEKFHIGLPFARVVMVGANGNIFSGGCNFQVFKRNDADDWQDMTQQDFPGCNHYSIIAAPNGNIVSSHCYSIDQGLNWISHNAFVGGRMLLKNGVIYNLDYGIYKSYDNGVTWEEHQIDNDTSYYDSYAVTESEKIIAHRLNNQTWIYEYVLLEQDGSVRVLDINHRSVASLFETSYTGSNIYFVDYNPNTSDYRFGVSYDEGLMFEYKSINFDLREGPGIYVDHLDNIFLYTSELILMSKDAGDTWHDVTPTHPDISKINGFNVGIDNYMYVATKGTGILKSTEQLQEPGKLTVYAYEDVNNNCQYDVAERLMDNILISIDGKTRSYTRGGSYTSTISNGRYDVVAELRSDLYYSCDNNQVAEIQEGNKLDTIYIPIRILENCADLRLNGSTPILRRCFNNTYYVEVFNTATAVAGKCFS